MKKEHKDPHKNIDVNPENHLKLVHACCQRFRGRGLEYDDIFQAGCMGLVKAAKNFDASRGVCFSTYAVPGILGEIKTLFQNNTSLKVSRNIKNLAIKINQEREKYIKSNEVEPNISWFSENLGVSVEKILEALEICKFPVSLDLNAEDEGFAISIPVEFEEEKIHNRMAIVKAMQAFDSRDKNLIYLRFFCGNSQSEIAKKLGITQVQVSRREKTLLKALKEKLA